MFYSSYFLFFSPLSLDLERDSLLLFDFLVFLCLSLEDLDLELLEELEEDLLLLLCFFLLYSRS